MERIPCSSKRKNSRHMLRLRVHHPQCFRFRRQLALVERPDRTPNQARHLQCRVSLPLSRSTIIGQWIQIRGRRRLRRRPLHFQVNPRDPQYLHCSASQQEQRILHFRHFRVSPRDQRPRLRRRHCSPKQLGFLV